MKDRLSEDTKKDPDMTTDKTPDRAKEASQDASITRRHIVGGAGIGLVGAAASL